MIVHWVQRQDLRTVTKEPITGLIYLSVRIFSECVGEISPQSWSQEGTENIERGGCSAMFCCVHVRDGTSTNSKCRREGESGEKAEDG